MQPDSRQTDRHQTDSESFFFTSLRPVLIFLLPLLPYPSRERVTRSCFLFSTGVRWDPVSKLCFLYVCTHIHICIAGTRYARYHPIFRMHRLNLFDRIACTMMKYHPTIYFALNRNEKRSIHYERGAKRSFLNIFYIAEIMDQHQVGQSTEFLRGKLLPLSLFRNRCVLPTQSKLLRPEYICSWNRYRQVYSTCVFFIFSSTTCFKS